MAPSCGQSIIKRYYLKQLKEKQQQTPFKNIVFILFSFRLDTTDTSLSDEVYLSRSRCNMYDGHAALCHGTMMYSAATGKHQFQHVGSTTIMEILTAMRGTVKIIDPR